MQPPASCQPTQLKIREAGTVSAPVSGRGDNHCAGGHRHPDAEAVTRWPTEDENTSSPRRYRIDKSRGSVTETWPTVSTQACNGEVAVQWWEFAEGRDGGNQLRVYGTLSCSS